MVLRTIPIIVSSDPANGAQLLSADGSSFEINLDDPIMVPESAKECTVVCQESTVWWVVPNITTGINDAFSIDDGGGPYAIVVPTGLYDVTSLQNATESAVIAAGGPAGMFTFIADSATQRIIIRVNLAGVTIDFTGLTTFRVILGFDSQVLGPTVGASTDFPGDNQAAFNTINGFLIHSDIVSRGIRTNGRFDQIIAQVNIDVAPGSQIVSRPFLAPEAPANTLIGALRKRIRFWLTDTQNNLVNTQGEFWTTRMIIQYIE